jgi:hypothetical protein
MSMTTLPTIDRLLEPVTACLPPEVAQRIIDISLDDPSIAERLAYLREKANEGSLTEQERSEYEGFVEANDLLTLIKDQVRSSLQHG